MTRTSTLNLTDETIELLRHHNVLKPLVKSELLEKTILMTEVSEEESTQCLEFFLKKNNLQEAAKLNKFLDAQKINQKELQEKLELPIRIEKYCRENFIHKAEARFLETKENLDLIVYSLIRVKDGFLARELYLRLSGNEASFADLAGEFSQGVEANTKGVIGPVPANQAHPILADRLRTSRPGQLLEPFCIDDWWLVVKLERYEPARFDEGTALKMAKELFEEWLEAEALCKIAEL